MRACGQFPSASNEVHSNLSVEQNIKPHPQIISRLFLVDGFGWPTTMPPKSGYLKHRVDFICFIGFRPTERKLELRGALMLI